MVDSGGPGSAAGSDDASSSHWAQWHSDYADPESELAYRLSIVQTRARAALDTAGPDPVRLISVCAGQAHDVIGALSAHQRATDAIGLLVEQDQHNVHVARANLVAAGLVGIDVVQGDAAATAVYADIVPAQVVLLCGIFGNVSDSDVSYTVHNVSRFCASDAIVIWTRSRRSPDLTPAIRSWFAECGFDEIAFDSPGAGRFSVGTHRLAGAPLPFRSDLRLFTFL
jgi:hypothetical protein